MTPRQTLSAAALCVGAILTAAPAFAGPPGDVFARRPVPAAAPADATHPVLAANCDCSSMKGDAAARDRCMALMGGHHPAAG
jgi:hypothetical protein